MSKTSEPTSVSADDTAEQIKKEIEKKMRQINWPEYLRKLGFSDNTVEKYLHNNQVNLNPYWINLKDEQGKPIVGFEKFVADEIFSSKRNEKVDEILAYNHVKRSIVQNRNRAWLMYDFMRRYTSDDIFKTDIVRLKFRLEEHYITQIEHDYDGNINEQRYHMISTWMTAEKLISVKKIAKALRHLELVAPNPEPKKAGCSTKADSSSGDEETDSQSSLESEFNEILSVLDTEIQSLKNRCLELVKVATKLQGRVPLQVTEQENVSKEEFGNTSSWSLKKQTDAKNITPENLFEVAARKYNEKVKSMHETTNKQRQNVVGVTGIAGIGKTTFCKFVLNHWIESHPHSFVFYVSIRDVDFTKDYNVLKFLLVSTNHKHIFKEETNILVLNEIEKSLDTLIVIDGVDEAETTSDFTKHPHGMSLYEEEKAYSILMNLLNCRILPNAKKLIASRPNAFLNFNPECKPIFMLQVLGLSEESQNLLCRQFSKTEEQQKHVQGELEKQPNISALCFIPIFARMIIPYFVDNVESKTPVLSVSDVFLNQLEQWQRNPKFHTDLKHVKQLAELAFDGVENRQFSFPSKYFAKHGIETKSIEPFMCAQAKNAQEPGLLILDGEKTFFFIHATWQEFLASLHLMVFSPYEKFSSKFQQMLQQSHWEVVVRFLFGFCHQEVQEKMRILFPESLEVKNKENVVKKQTMNLLPHLSKLPGDFPVPPTEYFNDIKSSSDAYEFNSREKDSTLFNICSWPNEARDDDLTKAVANSLPNPLLLSGEILPHEVMCFCHVLSAAEEPHLLNVGDWRNPATFTGPGLHTLLSTIQQSKHKIPKLHLMRVDMSANFDLILELLPDLTELTLLVCGLTIPMVEKLVDVITQHNIHLSCLDLSGNKLNGVGKYLAKSIHIMQMLRLIGCSLQEDDITEIGKATANRETNMSWLDLSGNVMSKKALDGLATSVQKLDGMVLDKCSVKGDDLGQVCHEISKRQKPMNILNLGGNNIGLIGVNHVSSGVHNIRMLWLIDCNLTIPCLQALIVGILNMDQPMVILELSDNKFGDEGAIALAGCLNKVEYLDVSGCDITTVGAKVLHKANRKWKRDIYGLPDIPQASGTSSDERSHEVAQPKKRCAIS